MENLLRHLSRQAGAKLDHGTEAVDESTGTAGGRLRPTGWLGLA
jgi:hypothetical protein